jgi:WXG100 family type VII secretion target
MGNDIVQATYDQLEEISGKFQNESQSMEQMMSSIKNAMNTLKTNWIGRGSDAFFAEMESEMLPAGQRLIEALHEGSAVTREISTAIRQAEEEASAPFKSWTI